MPVTRSAVFHRTLNLFALLAMKDAQVATAPASADRCPSTRPPAPLKGEDR